MHVGSKAQRLHFQALRKRKQPMCKRSCGCSFGRELLHGRVAMPFLPFADAPDVKSLS